MGRGPLRRFFWRMVDALDYFLTLASLRILDALAGPCRRRKLSGGESRIGSGWKGRSPRSSGGE